MAGATRIELATSDVTGSSAILIIFNKYSYLITYSICYCVKIYGDLPGKMGKNQGKFFLFHAVFHAVEMPSLLCL